MDCFELMSSDHFHVILHPDKKHALIFNRLDGTVATINHEDVKELSNLKRIGRVYGIVGRYLNKYLVLIKNRALVGTLYEPTTKTENLVYVITQVQVIDVSSISICNPNPVKANSVRYDATFGRNESEDDSSNAVELTSTTSPEDFSSLPVTISTSSYVAMQSRSAQWNPFKLANSLRPKMSTQFLRSTGVEPCSSDNTNSGPSQTSNSADDSDKRLIEEMMKLFNNTNSFYFSSTLDLTNRFSRKKLVKSFGNEAVWKTAEERFFWNKYMLKDLIELSEKDNDANYFICVILQGFIAIENHTISMSPLNNSGIENGLLATNVNSITTSNTFGDRDPSQLDESRLFHDTQRGKNYQLALVSRRSVLQAGTRYRRRGCDEEGNCANFVETEQIFRYRQHFTSVVIIRGSIPLFWYQSGYNYRPPPVLYRSEEENHLAFSKHFSNLIESYEVNQIIAVDCTEQSGREKNIHDAYKKHIEKLKDPRTTFKLIEFDFHRHCRGRQCSDTQVEKHLKSCGLNDNLLKSARYYWNDGAVVWKQDGIFRVNCLDCSDRTNVVQRAIALQILDAQLSRLGVIAPDTCPEDNEFRRIMQIMWSTNGNVLSTQYCGTRALFGSEKKISGYLQDTYSSASRYYISKFRDVYRQAAIDAMLGVVSVNNGAKFPGHAHNPPLDQYELLNFDPIFLGRGGGTLLKDVGSRVSNRLARLKGKFNVMGGFPKVEADETIDETDFEDRIEEAFGEMSIDWPSSENINDANNQEAAITTTTNILVHASNSEDSFQDDEFGQLMLTTDSAEIKRLRKDEGNKPVCSDILDKDKRKKSEEIHMTEACSLKSNTNSENATSTTST